MFTGHTSHEDCPESSPVLVPSAQGRQKMAEEEVTKVLGGQGAHSAMPSSAAYLPEGQGIGEPTEDSKSWASSDKIRKAVPEKGK